MANKEKVFIGIPAFDNQVNLSLLQMAYELPVVSANPGTAYDFTLLADGGQRPQEWCRNRIIQRFLETDCETLLMIDNDMVQMGWRTLKLLETPDYDIAGPVQLMFHEINHEQGRDIPELYACAFVFDRTQDNKMHPTYPVPNEPMVRDVEAVGSGCMAIKRHVLEDERMHVEPGMQPPAIFRNVYEANGNRLRGLDIDFCKRAHELGYKIKMNWEAEIGHLKTIDLNQVNVYGLAQYRGGMEAARREIQVDQAEGGEKAGNGRVAGADGEDDGAVAQFRLDRGPGGPEAGAGDAAGTPARADAEPG